MQTQRKRDQTGRKNIVLLKNGNHHLSLQRLIIFLLVESCLDVDG